MRVIIILQLFMIS